jgi:Kef-type K+ transport system membrane component KefB
MFALLAVGAAGGHEDPVVGILIALVFVLLGAKLAGELVERLGQPAVLGELLVGVVFGNLALFGGPALGTLRASESFGVLAELGAILLLFHVGLESTPREMMAVGGRATLVATVGVVTPMALGFLLGEATHPDESWMLHAFLGAMLSATSVGITARVLADLNALATTAARIILGAAVIDDVMGLMLLAVVSGVIESAASGTTLGVGSLVLIGVKAVVFLAGALVLGALLSPRIFRASLALRSKNIALTLALAFCFLLSYLAMKAGLAPIVGAYAAGLVLENAHFKGHVERGETEMHQALAPLVALFVPVFFVRMGMLVDLQSFADTSILRFAVLLTLAAALGKLVCGLVVPKGVSRLTVGIGMLPRGEVGLIFAAMGAKMMLDGRPVVDAGTYAAAVFMVVVTTMVTPPLLARTLRRSG